INVDVVNPKPGWKIGVHLSSQPKSGGVVHRGWHTELNHPFIIALNFRGESETRIAGHFWSPSNPHLIDIHVALVPDPKADLLGFGQEWMPKLTGPGAPEKKPPVAMADWIKSYTALRKTSLGKDEKGVTRMMLNNKPLFQFGPLDQGFWPDGLYTAPTDEALKFDIEITRQYGFNMIRKHVKVEPARWYYHCDKLGMLVWQDMPSGDKHAQWDPFGKHDNTEATRSPESSENFRREWKAIIDALRNHPCIVMWVPFNEGWGQADTVAVTKWTKEYDPTRLVNCASGGNDFPVGDVIDVHRYPGPFAPKPTADRAAVLGEYGGLGLPLKGHTWQGEKNWGYRSFIDQASLTNAYLDLLDKLHPMIGSPGLSAAIYTQTTDVEIEVNGLLTYDRAVQKIPLDVAARAHKALYQPPPQVKTLVESSREAAQTWQYTTGKPADGWEKSAFDASTWKTGPGGFGEKTTPGSVVRTEWKSNDIWLRRTFDLKAAPTGEVRALIHHDEDTEIYVNGQRVKSVTGYSTDYGTMRLVADAAKAFRAGPNTLAVHCKQTGGGQYIDVGIVELIETK
ncbi:MAG: glycoside hydrolase family 2 TIM barrel-domain containing protein, partial [Planctomycetota bacterium]